MSTHITAVGVAVGLALGLALSPTSSATAAAPHHHAADVRPLSRAAPSSKVARHAAARTAAEHRRVKRYWTPERMLAAVPVGADQDDVAADPSTNAVQEPAQPRLGKLFFSIGGLNYVCSGTATESFNHDVVTTAGHCLSPSNGTWATNVSFAPGYEDGLAPDGVWTAEKLTVPAEWFTDQNYDVDAGFVVLDENLGTGTVLRSLTDAVGGYPITFDEDRGRSWGLDYQVYGYPGVAPFDGRTLWSCDSAITNVSQVPDMLGLTCGMGPGSSGGAWIAEGSIHSVTSSGSPAYPGVTFGSYFGDEVKAAYDEAQSYGVAVG